MTHKLLLFIAVTIPLLCFKGIGIDFNTKKEPIFNREKDLLLVQFDCKTDVDDLHTIAAFKTLISNSAFSDVQYHAVAGTYGIQEGLYVPPNVLCKSSFGNNWTDADKNLKNAIEKVTAIALKTLSKDGAIWIAEAGQSDFTAALIKVITLELGGKNISKHIHVVQHSDWNEKQTSKESLAFVKEHSSYQKIPDGNSMENGTPGFCDPNFNSWRDHIKDPKLIEVWQLAMDLSNTYNGKEGRYDNKAISDGGMDFSDLVEVCWILGIPHIKDTEQFFREYSL